MDEVDGMSGGDRGGVGALKKIITTTKVFFLTSRLITDPNHLYLQRSTTSKIEAS